VTDERGGRGTSTGETVEVHDSEGDGEVNVVDDGLSASVRSIGEANAAEAQTHLAEVDGPDDSGDEYVCEDCGAAFDCKEALGGHRKGCDGDGNGDKAEGVTVELTREEAYQAIRKSPPNVARRVYLEVSE
jgi:hypothetical protein